MKKSLCKSVHRLENLESAWHVIEENGRFSGSKSVRQEIALFSEDPAARLRSIQNRLSRGRFEFGQARGIPLPKKGAAGSGSSKAIRPIVLASLEARVVQRAVLNVLLQQNGLKEYVHTPYSFGGLRRLKDASQNSPALAAVPEAIDALLQELPRGRTYYAKADISGFFTRISKSTVIDKIAAIVPDPSFVALVRRAIHVELSNLAQLREKAKAFPIEDIGVAQGNSLSPLLGNIYLHEFDRVMNDGDCRCIRYIDDFIILAPSAKAANARLRLAKRMLSELGMQVSPEKSSAQAIPVRDGVEFLGIEIVPGWIRPSKSAQARFIANIDQIAQDGCRSIVAHITANGQAKGDLLSILRRLNGVASGWGKHYWFCNDTSTWSTLDTQVDLQVRKIMGCYSNTIAKLTTGTRAELLGICRLAPPLRQPFQFPRVALTSG